MHHYTPRESLTRVWCVACGVWCVAMRSERVRWFAVPRWFGLGLGLWFGLVFWGHGPEPDPARCTDHDGC